PGGLALDSHDVLYVTDEAGAAVEVFAPSGKLTQTIRGTFGKTRGLAVGTLGQLYVVDHERGRVLTLDPSGKQLASWGEGVDGIGGLERRPDDLDTVFVRYLGQTSLIDRTWRRYGELGCLFADLGHEVRER